MSQCPSDDPNNPMYECPDDSGCAFCGQLLPEFPREDSWLFEGYCDAECAALDLVSKAQFSDDELHASQRATICKAIYELARKTRLTE